MPHDSRKIFRDTGLLLTPKATYYGSTDSPSHTIQSSDMVRAEEKEITEEQVQMGFAPGDDKATVLENVVEKLYKPTRSANADLNQFLNRPVRIATQTMSTGSTTNYSYNPWELFFDHPSIRNKIDNYAFVRCDLHIKIMINASPFYYGAILAAYKPLQGEFTSAPISSAGNPNIAYSQLPHVWMYPQTSQAGEMILPFIAHTEWLTLGSATNLDNFGTIFVRPVVPLAYANAGTASDVEFTIYAWAENVELSGLTVDLAVQSKDEYSTDGAISKPASAVARAADMLSTIPVLSPFATATSIGANAVANIAGLFGYTKVPVVTDAQPVKNLPFRGFAVSDINDATEKVSVDCKNELTVNNECIGDPCPKNLDISTFVQRQSYLTNFTWTAADSSSTLLWNSYVSPYMFASASGTNVTYVNGTPMFIPANLFYYWRGDIIYDFKIICSQYHRGRLRISWDPVGNVANTSDCETETYTHIMDITDNTNVSIRVPYNQRVSYLKTPSNLGTAMYSTTALAKDTSDTINGILTVRVLTEQTSPVASADVTVVVSVRGAENLEFAEPKELDDDLAYYQVQSGDINDVNEVTLGEHSTCDPNVNLVYMGEKVTSFRELLQRSNLQWVDFPLEGATSETNNVAVINRRPIYPGYDTNGIHYATGLNSAVTESYNFVKNTPYHMLAQCFLGERGSITWNIDSESFQPQSLLVGRGRTQLVASSYKNVAGSPAVYTTSGVSALITPTQYTCSGSALTCQRTNMGASVCAPMYSQYTFQDTAPGTRTLGKTLVSGNDSLRIVTANKQYKERGTDNYYVFYYFNVGPDHSFYYFLNVPTMFKYSSTPVAAADP